MCSSQWLLGRPCSSGERLSILILTAGMCFCSHLSQCQEEELFLLLLSSYPEPVSPWRGVTNAISTRAKQLRLPRAHTQHSNVGFCLLGGGGSFTWPESSVFEYLKSCAVLCLNVVCGHCAVRLSPCLSAGYTEVCYLYVVVIKDRLLFN